MDFIRIVHAQGDSKDSLGRRFHSASLSTNYEEPIYEFHREGEFHCSLRIKDKHNSNTLCEIFFTEPDLHNFIMKAEMASRFPDYDK